MLERSVGDASADPSEGDVALENGNSSGEKGSEGAEETEEQGFGTKGLGVGKRMLSNDSAPIVVGPKSLSSTSAIAPLSARIFLHKVQCSAPICESSLIRSHCKLAVSSPSSDFAGGAVARTRSTPGAPHARSDSSSSTLGGGR